MATNAPINLALITVISCVVISLIVVMVLMVRGRGSKQHVLGSSLLL